MRRHYIGKMRRPLSQLLLLATIGGGLELLLIHCVSLFLGYNLKRHEPRKEANSCSATMLTRAIFNPQAAV